MYAADGAHFLICNPLLFSPPKPALVAQFLLVVHLCQEHCPCVSSEIKENLQYVFCIRLFFLCSVLPCLGLYLVDRSAWSSLDWLNEGLILSGSKQMGQRHCGGASEGGERRHWGQHFSALLKEKTNKFDWTKIFYFILNPSKPFIEWCYKIITGNWSSRCLSRY